MADAMLSRTFRTTVVAVVLATSWSCVAPVARHPATEAPATEPPPVATIYDAQRQVDAYIASGRYDADFAAVVAAARAWVEERAPKVKRPAIVLDIDETSLSNWPAYRANGWVHVRKGGCDLEHGPCSMRAWLAMAKAPALVPTLALVRRARELGVAVFFVTGRPADLRAATERNLREQGYVWDGMMLRPGGGEFASAVEFKAHERRKIAERGYAILLSMGDQQSDLDGGYAEKTFKLPNPVYFLP